VADDRGVFFRARTRPEGYRPYEASEIFHKVSELLSDGRRLALASIVRAEGSAPRHATAKMIVTEQGSTYGSIGGGSIETLVQREARKVLASGKPIVIQADLGDDSWSGISLACGGKVEVFIELVKPSPRLVILGCGHNAESVAKVARNMGYIVVVIDPFTKLENFLSADEVLTEEYAAGLEKVRPTKADTVMICTRTHQYDEKALKAALEFKLGYLGVLGSKNRARVVLEALMGEGVPEYKLTDVHTPMGLDIGAETPEEVAISIMAEVLMLSRGGTGQPKSIKPLASPKEEIRQDARERR
jgi:xanthine dehydrogenase accessory factor